ncbi:MAG: lipopolysaccharide kinase InaA family protein [Planctomycetota bacterium]|nr:lipopolysaccharide kinase InaA family protein [Planctomycetota bacterium]
MDFFEVRRGSLRLIHGEHLTFDLAESYLAELGGQLAPLSSSPPTPRCLDGPGGPMLVKQGRGSAGRRLARGLSRAPSRSLAAFRMGSILQASGVPTPRPLAAIELCGGPFGTVVSADLLLTEWIDGPDLSQALPRATAAEHSRLLSNAARSIALMHIAGCRHRDLKAANLLNLQADSAVLIADLDGARACRGGPSHRQRLRDLARFMTSLEVMEVEQRLDGVAESKTKGLAGDCGGGEQHRRAFLRHYFDQCPDLAGNDGLRQRWQVRATAWMRSKISRNQRRGQRLS